MVFKVEGKVALITGGADGIGLSHVRELLKQGAKGVVIADINAEKGEKQAEELKKEFGKNRVLFVRTDVVDKKSFENAFEVTIKYFGNIDILINNAGICNDHLWEKEIDINLKGTVHGTLLGIEKYLRYFKQDNEGVILNTSSISFVDKIHIYPVYVSTKLGILGLTKEWGSDIHYKRTNVRVVAICPGATITSIMNHLNETTIQEEYMQLIDISKNFEMLIQSPDFVAKEAISIMENAPNGSFWVIEDSQPAYHYIMPEKRQFIKNVL